MIKNKVLATIKEFNKFRSPEATAELISIENDVLIVKMSSTYCTTAVYTITSRIYAGISRIT